MFRLNQISNALTIDTPGIRVYAVNFRGHNGGRPVAQTVLHFGSGTADVLHTLRADGEES